MSKPSHPAKTPSTATGVLAVLAGVLAVLALSASPAAAATGHEYLPAPSQAITAGPPASEATLSGPLSGVKALAAGTGRVWVVDRFENEPFWTRVDAFNSTSGAFLAPQLLEEDEIFAPNRGLAVGHLGGEEQIYAGATKEGQLVIAVYAAATGHLLHVWDGAATAAGSFTGLAERNGLALDGSEGLETSGDLYVATTPFEPAEKVIDVLEPQAGGAEPATTVAEIKGTCAAPETSCPGAEVPFTAPSGVAVSAANGDVLVTDNESVIDVFRPTASGHYEYLRQITGTPTGANGAEAPFAGIVAIAVDPTTGNVYLADTGAGAVDELGPSGAYLGRLTGTPAGPFHTLHALAVDPASGRLFVASYDEEARAGAVDVFGPDLLLPDVATEAATEIEVAPSGQIDATLHGTVNPVNAGPLTSCAFAWGETAAFGESAACEPASIPDGNAAVPVKAQLTGLEPDTTYRFRLGAANANGQNPGEPFQDRELHTPGPGLHGVYASEVASTSADLNGSVDPQGDPTSYYFQYGITTAYGSQAPATSSFIGAGVGDQVLAPQHLQGLEPSTTYHYRLVAVSEVEVEGGAIEPVAFPGADRTFTTQAPGGGFALPDARQWQLVSPPDKRGALIRPIGPPGVTQSAASGGGISYVTNLPTEADPKGNEEAIQVLSQRSASGWHSRDLTTTNALPGFLAGFGGEFRAFSPDLSQAVVEPPKYTSLAPEVFPPDTGYTAYLRDEARCAATPSACYQPLLTTAPGYANVPAGTNLDAAFEARPEFVSATPDVAHVILSSAVALSSTPIPPSGQLYEWSAAAPLGQSPRLVSVLPDGEPSTLGTGLGNPDDGAIRNAVSTDGSRVVFAQHAGHLYLRYNATEEQSEVESGQCTEPAKACTIQLDAVQPGASGQNGANPHFQLAAADGSRVLFTDTQRLTADSHAGSNQPDLYACEVAIDEGQLECRLTDLTAGLQAGDVQGLLLGASQDASTVYFTANAKLTPAAIHGNCEVPTSPAGAECNLYTSHHGAGGWSPPELVTIASGDDFPDWSGNGGTDSTLTARVSTDGDWLAFMSDRSLTGYDNRDAVSGQLDEEVYLYHASTGRLLCASCNPTGARPHGVEFHSIDSEVAGGNSGFSSTQWIAANIPGFTQYRINRALHQSRYLSDSGRLFFNSADAIVPADVNANQDVYQYEPAGVGDCSAATGSGSVLYLAADESCVGLISSGRASGESGFLDASESGSDVFFMTAERLTPGDVDGAYDVYDAHSCSASSPCLPEPPPAPPICAGDACQAPAAPPSDQSPGSLAFQGAGNVHECPRGKVKKSGKCVAKKKHKKSKHKRHAKKRNAGHNRGGVK